MIYWKYGIHFGKTNEEGIKMLQDLNYKIKSISHTYYMFLSFMKWFSMIVLMLPIIALMTLVNLCKAIAIILEKPIKYYNKYFIN